MFYFDSTFKKKNNRLNVTHDKYITEMDIKLNFIYELELEHINETRLDH